MVYLEDIQLEAVETAGPYELTAPDVVEFSAMWDPFPFHTDREAAEESIFGGLAASAAHMVCIANRLLHDTDLPAIRAVVAHEFRYPNPARAGDRLSLETRFVSKRPSKSRPENGLVNQETHLINQDGMVVLEMKSVLLVAARGT